MARAPKTPFSSLGGRQGGGRIYGWEGVGH